MRNLFSFRGLRLALMVIQCVAFTGGLAVVTGVSPSGVASACPNTPSSCADGGEYSLPIHISTQYAKQFILAHVGAQAVAHMISRVETLPPQPAHPHHYTSYVSQYSPNWGGYVADLSGTSHHVTTVAGTFNAVSTCADPCPPISTWVGIGGYRGTNFVQAGLDSQLHQLWYELVPQGPVYLPVYPRVGDQIEDEIIWDSSTKKWLLYLDDQTTGQYYTNEVAWSSDQSTADWIEEQNGIAKVPTVPTVTVGSGYWEDGDGTVRAINNSLVATVRKVILRSSVGGCLVPSGLSSNGEGFSIARQANC